MLPCELNCTVDTTPVPWLHVLSNIEPPQIRRKFAAHNEWKKCMDETRSYDLPIKIQLEHPPPPRLISRSPIWSDIEIQSTEYDVNEQWKKFWNESPAFTNKHLIENPHEKLEGFNLQRREWKMLNRFRSGHGCAGDQMYRWKFRDSPYCDCGPNVIQSMEHVLQDCPIRKFNSDLKTLNEATIESVNWLRDLDIDI